MIEGTKGSDMRIWAKESTSERDFSGMPSAHRLYVAVFWGTVSLGSTDLSFHAVACSPSNVSEDAGCIYAVLDSNAEVFLFKPVKDPLTGQWLGVIKSMLESCPHSEVVIFRLETCMRC